MSRQIPIQIVIPEPCNQDWDKMTVNSMGRHCDHCKKTVIDFTRWSDTALHNFFSKTRDNVCGRLLSSQLSRPIRIPHQPHSRLYKIVMVCGFTLLYTQAIPTQAQSYIRRNEQIVFQNQNDTTIKYHSGRISGRILDEKKEPLPSTVIQLFQNNILITGTIADYNGNYNLDALKAGRYNVMSIYTGYDSVLVQNVVIEEYKSTNINFNMLRNQCTNLKITGALSIIQYRVPLIDMDNPTKRTFTYDEINHLPY